jgi:hypothetical protein
MAMVTINGHTTPFIWNSKIHRIPFNFHRKDAKNAKEKRKSTGPVRLSEECPAQVEQTLSGEYWRPNDPYLSPVLVFLRVLASLR